MSTMNGIEGTASALPNAGFDAGTATLSADALLAYCQAQLGSLDGQINDQINAQNTALSERKAVQSAQGVLAQFGTAGPQNIDDMKSCVQAIDHAISLLPAGDPVAAQLVNFREKMCSDYGYQAPRALTGEEEQQLISAQAANETSLATFGVPSGFAQPTIDHLNQVQTTGFFIKPPRADDKQWPGTTDALANIASDVQSGAEIQMLHLQDLVSQRQQAVQLCSGMMSKTDQTLEDQAKAIGR
jgi:hypothetical protein